MVAWSREITWGTPKHPPLPAWLVGAWFSIFPLATWAYDLFAVGIATVSLWVAFVVSTHYLDGVKSAVGLALLTLLPFFNFHALQFNANSALAPWWALPTWFFLPSFERRRAGDRGGKRSPAQALFRFRCAFRHRRGGRRRPVAAPRVALPARLRDVRICARIPPGNCP